jgi:transposase
MRNIRSVREIECACKENINFMWLLNGFKAPDHNTIARFIKQVNMNEILVEINKYLFEINELKYDYLLVDGTKIEANANKFSFVWKKSTLKYIKVQGEIEQ